VVLKYNPAGAAALKKIPAGVPVVAISGTRSPGVPQVALVDERQAGELVTDYLLGLGHRTVHHVRMPQPLQHNPRMTGWRLALERAGAPVPPIQEATWQPESGRQVGLRMAADPAVTAVFCGNDEIAMGFIKGLTEAGRQVPDDVSVVGFDDHPLAAMWNPGLTTIRQDFVTLGHRAYQRLQGDSTSMEILAELPELMIRDSAAPPRPQREFASAG
jgi:DNA-binding LacI/PurR family transcriptional regulator